MFLVVYVDDFRMSGPSGNLAKGWSLISKGLKVDPPTPLGQYLGCDHEQFSFTLPCGRKARGVRYNMSHFIEQCVERYLSLAPAGTKLKTVSTPFVAEDAGVGESRAPVKGADLVQC